MRALSTPKIVSHRKEKGDGLKPRPIYKKVNAAALKGIADAIKVSKPKKKRNQNKNEKKEDLNRIPFDDDDDCIFNGFPSEKQSENEQIAVSKAKKQEQSEVDHLRFECAASLYGSQITEKSLIILFLFLISGILFGFGIAIGIRIGTH